MLRHLADFLRERLSGQEPHEAHLLEDVAAPLEHPQIEHRQDRQQMVEDVRLDLLVFAPIGRFREAVHLDRQSGVVRLELTHQKRQIRIDRLQRTEIFFDINAEGADVGDAAAVDGLRALHLEVVVPVLDLLPFFVQIIVQQHEILQPGDLLVVQEPDAPHVDVQRALDAASAGLVDPAPVDERLHGQLPRRHGHDGHVPVLHLHRVQSDVHDDAVHVFRRQLDPVAQLDHVVCAQLDPGNKRQDRVLEDQDQDRRHSAQAGQQHHRALVHHNGNDHDERHDHGEHLDQLDAAFDRVIARVRMSAVPDIHDVQEADQRRREADERERHADLAGAHQIVRVDVHRFQDQVHDHDRDDVRQTRGDRVHLFLVLGVPHRDLVEHGLQPEQKDLADGQIDQDDDDQPAEKPQVGQKGMLLQRFPDVCGQFGNIGRSVIGPAEARARCIARDGRGGGWLLRGGSACRSWDDCG